MTATSLIVVCVLAFAVVFVVLVTLAAAIHLLTLLFPARAPAADAVLVAAVADTVATLLPGTVVTRIEEEP